MHEDFDRPAVIAALRSAGCVFAEDEADLLIGATADTAELRAMVAARSTGVPIEHVVGWADFCGLRVAVDPGVFVPRQRTQVLARLAATSARDAMRAGKSDAMRAGKSKSEAMSGATSEPASVGLDEATSAATVMDLCCGSGAIALVVASSVSGVRLIATDIDPVAVACARRNLAPYRAMVVGGDLYDAVPIALAGAVDVLVANVPYVPSRAIEYLPAEAREYEPRTALDGGGDGLDVLRRVAGSARKWLAPGGRLLTEASLDQLDEALAVMRRAGLRSESVVDEELDVAVVLGVHSA